MTPAVSIVLLTRNGAATLGPLLDALRHQRGDVPVEIIALDSGSQDGTLELLTPRVDKVIGIAPDDFDHGLTRNLGLEHARGELVVLLVQDAIPASDTWLMALTEPLFSDASLAGAFARQIPRPDSSPITRYYHARWAGAAPNPRVSRLISRQELEALAPLARLERCTFDNVCSCIRRAVWARYPFKQTPIAEDLEWAREVLLAGFGLAYVPDAVVVHAHERSARYELARTYLLHRRLYELFGVRTIPTLPDLIRAIASSVALHVRCERSAGRRLASWRGVALAGAWPLGQYVGATSAKRGWALRRLRGV